MSKVLYLLMVVSFAYCSCAAQPAHDYSEKTVKELLDLLESKDASVRTCAAIYLGDRYRNWKITVVNGLAENPKSPTPELPLPAGVVPSLAKHLKTDSDISVRTGTVIALRDLRFRTNTTLILVTALADKDPGIRLWTCDALIEISQEYAELLQPSVISTLAECLKPDAEVETIWQAAYTAERLGSAGKLLVPALERLKEHPSSKVRYYAARALLRIQRKRVSPTQSHIS